eukprot:scaffold107154_cov36-Phaeocystis_antarctica.AAC.1
MSRSSGGKPSACTSGRVCTPGWDSSWGWSKARLAPRPRQGRVRRRAGGRSLGATVGTAMPWPGRARRRRSAPAWAWGQW